MSEVGGSRPKRAKTGGRKKGTPNKATKELKDMILGALNDAGGQEYLLKQARKKNPAPFLNLIAKVLPTTIKGDVDVNVKGSVSYKANMPQR